MLRKSFVTLIVCLFVLVGTACAAPPAPPPTAAPAANVPTAASVPATAVPTAAAPDHVNAAWVAITGNQSPAWIAQEGGLFKKYNLDVALSFIQGSSPATASMVGGSTDIVQMAGPAAIAAANKGADVVLIAGFLNKSVFKLVGDPSIKSIKDLKGKTIAITKFGSSDEFVLRRVLKDNGLDPSKDVKITTSGDATGQLAEFKSKIADAILLSPPNDVKAEKEGAALILDTIPLNLPYSAVGLASTRKYIAAHRADVLDFIRAESDALRRFKEDRPYAESVMSKYLKTNDKDILDASWDAYSKAFADIPYPSPDGIQEIMDETGIKGKTPADFSDPSLVKELEDSGFYKTASGAASPLPTLPPAPTETPKPK